MYKIRHNLTTDALISIYYTLCYPHLTYCIPIWASTWPSFLNKLAVAQRKVIRCIFFLGKFESVGDYFTTKKLLKLESIHKYFSLLLIYKMLNFRTNDIFGFVDNFVHTISSNVDLISPQFRTALFKNSILCSGPEIFNTLPLNIKKIIKKSNYQLFKREVRDHILKSS